MLFYGYLFLLFGDLRLFFRLRLSPLSDLRLIYCFLL